MDVDHSRRRKVRSFVKRTGRMTPSQTRALTELWPVYGVASDATIDVFDCFDSRAPVVLEIGFGNGETFITQAASDPKRNYLGIEVHEPGIGHCLLLAEAQALENVRVVNGDATEVLKDRLPANSVRRINLYFPDPWPKKRHHKRRLVQHSFLDQAAQALERHGHLCIATDWRDYAEHIDGVLEETTRFEIVERVQHASDRPLDRPTTKFERRGLRQGHTIWDWRLAKREE